MNTRAFITGIAGLEVSAAEREFIRAERPWGFILFKRNIDAPAQVTSLVRELRAAINNPEAPVLIDQEGGRVQRFGPPNWPVYPAGVVFGTLYDIDPALGLEAARLSARLIADDLIPLGVTVDCLPLADVPVEGADAVIGNRAYGTDPAKVAAIGRAVTEGLEQGGCFRFSSIFPAMVGPLRIPISGCRRSIRRKRSWNGPILPRFNRWRTCRWP